MSKKLLYISYDGLLEPLGSSQILSYFQHLSKDYNITIISFEKQNDWLKKNHVEKIKKIIIENNINWKPLNYSKNKFYIFRIINLFKCFLIALSFIKKEKISLIHTRSYIPGLIGIMLKSLTSNKHIFDMRGFWIDERIEWNIWKKKNFIYHFFRVFENKLFTQSDAIISLTNQGADIIKKKYLIKNNLNTPIYVIPTCTDLNQFNILNKKNKDFIITHLGPISTRYDFNSFIFLYKIIRKNISAKIKIINKNEHNLIKKTFIQNNINNSHYQIQESEYFDVSKCLQDSKIGVFFPKRGFYLNGYFPTKLGEFLACGIPVVTFSINKDVDDIIIKNNVGIIINDLFNDVDAKKIINMANDQSISIRCRETSKKYFSAIDGANIYNNIYQHFIN